MVLIRSCGSFCPVGTQTQNRHTSNQRRQARGLQRGPHGVAWPYTDLRWPAIQRRRGLQSEPVCAQSTAHHNNYQCGDNLRLQHVGVHAGEPAGGATARVPTFRHRLSERHVQRQTVQHVEHLLTLPPAVYVSSDFVLLTGGNTDERQQHGHGNATAARRQPRQNGYNLPMQALFPTPRRRFLH